jgi:transcriptional regulator with PAS, ATPase and Fis domain
MFGYERGSFTGALSKGKRGLVEAADGGTLFLDEVGEIPLSSQGKMLQFIEETAIKRVGATQLKQLNIQIIAATNKQLGDMVAKDAFRQDLFYRLSVVTLRIPPLRECSGVLDKLVDQLLADASERRGTPLKLDPLCREHLRAYRMPGNIRELQNIIDHLAVKCGRQAKMADLMEALANLQCGHGSSSASQRDAQLADAQITLAEAVQRFEERLIQDAIARTGSKRKAAVVLGVDVSTISRKSRRST